MQALTDTGATASTDPNRLALTDTPAGADLILARALFDDGQLEDAAEACRAVLAANLDDTAALHLLGLILLRQGAPAEAVAMLAAAVARHVSAEALNDLGEALHAVGLPADAEARFRDALAHQPDEPRAAYNLACLLQSRGEHAAATPLLRTAVAGMPEFANAWLGLGNTCLHDDDLAEAERCFRAAIAARPDFVEAHSNLGNALVAQQRLTEATASYQQALALRPDNPETSFACALALLLSGDFRTGWQYFEARRKVADLRWNYARRPGTPQWQPGMSLDGARVLLLAEQGAGDVLQFARYAPLLAARAAEVVLEAPAGMRALLASLQGVARVVEWDDPAPGSDIACPLLSLPLYFATTPHTVPHNVPYLRPPVERLDRWRDWLRPLRGRRIGLVCSGRPEHPLDRNRSIPLVTLAPILAADGCAFVMLQPELRERDAPALAASPSLCWPGPLLTDFADTAAILQELDLLITVDTAVAHLAGALGRPVWLMLPHAPDWRWLLGRSDTPWYPTMTLYRQPAHGDWDTVVAAIRRDLDGRR